LEDRESDINYNNEVTKDNSAEAEDTYNWWTSRRMPELLQTTEEVDPNSNSIRILDRLYNKAEKDGNIKALDVYRSFMEKKDQSKLSRL
jgi:hypothetical protein